VTDSIFDKRKFVTAFYHGRILRDLTLRKVEPDERQTCRHYLGDDFTLDQETARKCGAPARLDLEWTDAETQQRQGSYLCIACFAATLLPAMMKHRDENKVRGFAGFLASAMTPEERAEYGVEQG
jgi:hypothetical protein